MKQTLLVVIIALFSIAPRCHAQDRNTITVSGTGTVMAQPDMAQISIHFAHTAATTQEAKRVVAKAMRQVQEILDEQMINGKNISTTVFSYDVEYEYVNGKRKKLGQRAAQTLVVKIDHLDKNPERLAEILDRVATIDKVEVENIQFDIENKAEFYRQSRALAYNKAYEKARQYAQLANRTISKALIITEYSNHDIAYPSLNKMALRNMAVEEADGFSGEASLPMGERSVTSTVNVVFEMAD